ncbi:hypothetical protein BGX30_009318, partial [Mortierella sp. GBA39]
MLRSDDRCDKTDRNFLGGDQQPADDIGYDHQQAPEQCRQDDRTPGMVPGQQANGVRCQQADETDRANGLYDGGRNEHADQRCEQPGPRQRQAKPLGYGIAESQQVRPAADQPGRRKQDDQQRRQPDQIAPAAGIDGAGQPGQRRSSPHAGADDQELDRRGAGRRHGDADQRQRAGLQPLPPGQHADYGCCTHGAHDGRSRQPSAGGGREEHDQQQHPNARAGGDAHHRGIRQRIADGALQHDAGHGETGSGKQRYEQAGQTHIKDDIA